MISVEDYEGSTDFQALIVAAEGKPERQMGSAVIAAEPPQWGVVSSTAQSLLNLEPAHLSPLVQLVKAQANLNGFVGMNEALKRTYNTLHANWDDMYPEADTDDPEDMHYARINLLREIADEPAFIENLYRIPVLSVKGIGEYSCRDIDISRGALAGSDEDKQRCQEGLIRGAIAETAATNLQATADSFQEIKTTCQELEALFLDKAGTYNTLSLEALVSKISAYQASFHEYAPAHVAVSESQDEAPSEHLSGVETPIIHQNVAAGVIKDRATALHTLDQVIDYYRTAEPSSPVGVLAQRASDMVTKPFFAVLQELAPTATDSFAMVLDSLSKNPTAFLLDDSYRRFLSGEQFPSPLSHNHSQQPQSVEQSANSEQTADAEDSDSIVDESARTDLPEPQSGDQLTPTVIPAATVVESPLQKSMLPVVNISSRQEVISVLGELEYYFIEHEPSNPISLVLAEMKNLVPKRFTELLAELTINIPETNQTAATDT